MKKTIIGILALLVAMITIAGMSPVGKPDTSAMKKAFEEPGKVSLYIENRVLTSRIYEIKGKETKLLYEEFRLGDDGERNILVATKAGGKVYFVRQYGDTFRWQLEEVGEKSTKTISSGLPDSDMRITDISEKDGTFWLTTVNDANEIQVSECCKEGQNVKLLSTDLWPRKISKAGFDGKLLYAITEDGEEYEITPSGVAVYIGKTEKETAPKIEVNTDLWLSYKRVTFMFVSAIWLLVAVCVVFAAIISTKAKKISTRITAVSWATLMIIGAVLVLGGTFMVCKAEGFVIAEEFFLNSAKISGIAVAVGTLFIYIVLKKTTRPMKKLVTQMEEIAEGRPGKHEVVSGKDEVHGMSRALQELGMSMSIRDYELDSTIKSYHRFIPQKLTELLERANIAEVSLGDNRRITGNVGLFSVGNRAEVRAELQDDEFVDFINLSFDTYQNCLNENRGCMISSGLRLSSMETLFGDSASDGVQSGLDFIGATQKIDKKGIPAPSPILILHHTSFLYGIAGEKERLYPYLSSSELEFLGSFTEKLHSAGVKIVATESYYKQIKDSGFSARYIGFVSDGDKEVFKLYEILDTYSVLERKIRLGYNKRFNEALNLFYKNDFFLARNIFSSILRECPSDGIVRWYVFACENLFNAGKNDEIDYSLFGSEN